jgi:hypothetical protein
MMCFAHFSLLMLSGQVREGKDIRTYFLCAASETEKKGWIDAIVASRKYYSALKVCP